MAYVYLYTRGRLGNQLFQYWVAQYIADALGWPLRVCMYEPMFLSSSVFPNITFNGQQVPKEHHDRSTCQDLGLYEYDIESVIRDHRLSGEPVVIQEKYIENALLVQQYAEYVRRIYHVPRVHAEPVRERIVIHMRIGDLESFYNEFHADYVAFATMVMNMHPTLPVLIVSENPHHHHTRDLGDSLLENGAIRCDIKFGNSNVYSDFEDIACSSVIVATNSTFSWWASFLNPHNPSVYIGVSNRQFAANVRNKYLYSSDTMVPGWKLYDLDDKEWIV